MTICWFSGLKAICAIRCNGISTSKSGMHSVRLLSGYDMPTVGLGTWQVNGSGVYKY